MSRSPYNEFTSEQLLSMLRTLLNEQPHDIDRIRAINEELAVREDQQETQRAWERFLSNKKQPTGIVD